MLKIGLTFRIVNASNYDEQRDAISHNWAHFLEKMNIIPIWIPNSISNLENLFSELHLDGVILSGGDNLGETPLRDKTELFLIKYCISRKIPLMGVCRGMQIINSFFGGQTQTIQSQNHIKKEHDLKIISENHLKILSNKINVNSFHYNVIKLSQLGNDLKIFAQDFSDKTIEGFYHDKLPILGVMWHPERQQKNFDKELIRKFFMENGIF